MPPRKKSRCGLTHIKTAQQRKKEEQERKTEKKRARQNIKEIQVEDIENMNIPILTSHLQKGLICEVFSLGSNDEESFIVTKNSKGDFCIRKMPKSYDIWIRDMNEHFGSNLKNVFPLEMEFGYIDEKTLGKTAAIDENNSSVSGYFFRFTKTADRHFVD